jgi:hypothetical protein
MTDMQEQAQSSTATTLARLERLCGAALEVGTNVVRPVPAID